jgi:hypothetical protein
MAGLGLLPVLSTAQQPYTKPSWYFSAFGGHSFRVLGSQDIRTDYGFGVAWQKPEPHFKWRHGPAELVMEGYYEHSNGQRGTRGKVTEALGVIWYARFYFPTRGFNLFGDVGEGGQLSTSESFDLGTRLNSSPMFGGGISIRQGDRDILIGLRILHVSNAGLNGSNRGQNQVLFYTAIKF